MHRRGIQRAQNCETFGPRAVVWLCLRQETRRTIAASALSLVSVILELPLVLVTRFIIDSVLPRRDVSALNAVIIALVGFMVVKGLIDVFQSYVSAVARQRIVIDLRMKLLRHLQDLGLPFVARSRSAYLAARIGNDSAAVGALLTGTILPAIRDVITLTVASVMLLLFEWRLALAAFAVVPMFALAVAVFARVLRRASALSQEAFALAWNRYHESISGMGLVKAFQTEDSEAVSVKDALTHSMNSSVRVGVLSSLSSYLIAFISGLGTLVILGYGGRMVIGGTLTLGTFVAFSVLVGYLFAPSQRLMNVSNQMQSAMAAIDRTCGLLAEPPEVKDPIDPAVLSPSPLSIRFSDVSFSYVSGHRVLNRITFSVESAKTVAVVGGNGAGKTTLVNLIPRLYEPEEGSIFLRGVDIRRLRQQDLRKRIGIVPQGAMLVSGTIRDNIRYGAPDASEEEIVRAALAASAYAFISRLPRGFDTQVGERGVTLSGGERQRIAISRALLRNPEILILDEATSEIDAGSEYEIQASLLKAYHRQMTFVIAHRFTTLVNADWIIVLDCGNLVGQGNHAHLFDTCPCYRELCEKQFIRQNGQLDGGHQAIAQARG